MHEGIGDGGRRRAAASAVIRGEKWSRSRRSGVLSESGSCMQIKSCSPKPHESFRERRGSVPCVSDLQLAAGLNPNLAV